MNLSSLVVLKIDFFARLIRIIAFLKNVSIIKHHLSCQSMQANQAAMKNLGENKFLLT